MCSLNILLCLPNPFFLMTLLTDFFIPFRGGKELSDQGPEISFWSKTICFILKRPTSIPPCPHLKQILLFVANCLKLIEWASASVVQCSRRICQNVFNPLISCYWKMLFRVSSWENRSILEIASSEFCSEHFIHVPQCSPAIACGLNKFEPRWLVFLRAPFPCIMLCLPPILSMKNESEH